MPNLSQLKRQRMLEFLNKIKEEHKNDDEVLVALGEIENELLSKKYGLVWEKHEENIDIQMRTHIPVFTEVKEWEVSTAPDQGYNFLLEGDNLHSLYLLEKTLKNKIDIIYIDPPYNTGIQSSRREAFIYEDRMIGEDDNYKHSMWLSFMNERLCFAQRILSENGIIFISINECEGAQLKLLCDEVLGENNFIGQLTWESTTQPTNAGKARFSLQKKVESIYCYAKNKNKKKEFLLKEVLSRRKYPHIGKFGSCRFEIIEKSDAGAYRRDTMKFPILGQFPRPGKRWQIGIDVARQLEAEGKVEIVDGIVKRAVYPEDEGEKKKYEPFWSHLSAKDVDTAQIGKDELNTILGTAVGFDTVKPVKLIKSLLSHFSKDSVVLDFFAGSGTTAQAVMELNKEDGGSRRFVLCTNDEGNICSKVAYPRLKTVITGERADGTRYSDGIASNLKYYRTDFISRNEEYISEALLEHITEMVQLEHGIKVDGKQYLILLDDDAVDYLEKHWNEYDDVKALYISKNVLLTTKQNELFAGINVHVIPDYYFKFELKEVGEVW